MGKNSFTMIETVITMVIVSFVIAIFLRLIQSDDQIDSYTQLQNISNNYKKSNTIIIDENFKFQ